MVDPRRFGSMAPAGSMARPASKSRSVDGTEVKDMTSGRILEEEISDEPNPPPKDKVWGYHLLLDMSGCNDRIDDKQSITAFFEELIREMGMKVMSELQIVTDVKEQDRGTSAVQMITTSSITYHSDDDHGALYLDIFSCLRFDPNIAIKIVKKYFAPQRIGGRFLERDAGFTDQDYQSEKLPQRAS